MAARNYTRSQYQRQLSTQEKLEKLSISVRDSYNLDPLNLTPILKRKSLGELYVAAQKHQHDEMPLPGLLSKIASFGQPSAGNSNLTNITTNETEVGVFNVARKTKVELQELSANSVLDVSGGFSKSNYGNFFKINYGDFFKIKFYKLQK